MLMYFPSKRVLWVAMVLIASACTPPADSDFFNRGGPEALLDVSSEVVTLGVENPAKLKELSAWIQRDRPTRAELYCNVSDPRCKNAKKLFDAQSIPVSVMLSADNSATLIYERILARDCNQRFVDNHDNLFNKPHPAFGCSVSANVVQHVSNKREFVNPNLSDMPMATGGVAAYNRAYAPRTTTSQPYGVGNSLVQASGGR